MRYQKQEDYRGAVIYAVLHEDGRFSHFAVGGSSATFSSLEQARAHIAAAKPEQVPFLPTAPEPAGSRGRHR